MPTSPAIQSTKLAPPRVPQRTVHRARLHDRIDAAPDAGLVAVTGAPGAGKTALLAEWAEACGDPVAWCSLDETDNDPAVFWEAVGEAVEGALGDGRPHDPRDERIGAGAAVDRVIDAVGASQRDRRLWLVLDDLHEIEDETILAELGRLVRRMPAAIANNENMPTV